VATETARAMRVRYLLEDPSRMASKSQSVEPGRLVSFTSKTRGRVLCANASCQPNQALAKFPWTTLETDLIGSITIGGTKIIITGGPACDGVFRAATLAFGSRECSQVFLMDRQCIDCCVKTVLERAGTIRPSQRLTGNTDDLIILSEYAYHNGPQGERIPLRQPEGRGSSRPRIQD